MGLRRTLLTAALVSSLLAIGLAVMLGGGASVTPNSTGSQPRSWTAAPLLAFAIIGTMGCLVGALTVRR